MNLPAVHAGGAPGSGTRARFRGGAIAGGRPTNGPCGQWQLTRLIRRGGRMDVFRARLAQNDVGPGCYVVKMPRRGDDDVAAAMLWREQCVASEALHPHLATALASGGPSGKFLVLPYLEGITLRRLIAHGATRAPMAVAKALGIVRQIAAALSALHQSGWLHGQVRPEHIIVSPQGHATLIDLTLARRLGSSECDCCGEPFAPTYLAPEWSLSRGRASEAADTYALGIVLYEMLTGRPPFVASNARQLLAMHRSAAPPGLRSLRPNASLECSQLVRRMLAKQPLRRPSDEELGRWLAEIEIAEL